MSSLVRCVDKDGKVRELSEKVVNNAYFMRKYGYKVQDLKKEAPIVIPESQETPSKIEPIEVKINTDEVAAIIDEKVEQLNKPKQRRTRKPKAQ